MTVKGDLDNCCVAVYIPHGVPAAASQQEKAKTLATKFSPVSSLLSPPAAVKKLH